MWTIRCGNWLLPIVAVALAVPQAEAQPPEIPDRAQQILDRVLGDRERAARDRQRDRGPADRDRDESADARKLREGGIPRGRVLQQENDDQKGTEEGAPRLRSESQQDAVRPRVVPPQRNQWKLGVYAYNTDTGVVITRVVPRSAAFQVGLEPGDRIISVDGFQIGWIQDRLYPLGSELQRQAGRRGYVTLLVQNVRNRRLLNLDVHLDRGRYGRLSTRDSAGN